MKKEQIYIISTKASKIINNVVQDENINNEMVLDLTYNYTDKETKEVKEAEPAFNEKYKASLPPCIDNLYFEEKYENEIKEYKRYKKSKVKKLYTDAIISVSFTKVYDKDGEFRMTSQDARKLLYTQGFTYKGNKYIEYKRSGAKAREGKTLFIKKELLDDMIAFSNLDLDFSQDKEVDIASVRAYQSLTLSGLDTTTTNTVRIKSSEILIINEEISKFNQKVMYTHEANDKVISTEEIIEVNNDIWDGQCLGDVSLFEACDRKLFGMMLLRQRMFKACCFNTNIQQYFKDNNINFVYDMWGNKKPASQIKLIITPSCLKFLKFKNKFNDDEKKAYDYWLKKLKETDNVFGICKSEHESKMGNMHQLSYQMVNALQLSQKEVSSLADFDVNYINAISTDIDKFIEHINKYEMSYSREAMFKLLSYNKDFAYTNVFKNFRKNTIQELKNKLKKGKLHVMNSDYCTVVSNPILMLKKASLSKTKKLELVDELEGYQAYSSLYEDGVEFGGFRNPLVCTGNIAHFTNKKPTYMKYFNLTKNIIIINSINCDVLNKCQGMDMDSDTMLVSNNETIVTKAKQAQAYLTPVNGLKGDKKLLPLTDANKADIDNVIAENAIGTVINQSQICNSYYSYTEDSKIYADICTLSSIAQLEIDKAKKYIEIDSRAIKRQSSKNIPTLKIGTKTIIVNNKKCGTYTYEKDIVANLVPAWMVDAEIVKLRDNQVKAFWSCGMQYLQNVSSKIEDIKRSDNKDIKTFLVARNWRENTRQAYGKQAKEIEEMITQTESDIKATRSEYGNNRDEEEKMNEKIRLLQTELITALASMKISTYTIYSVIKTSTAKNVGSVVKYLLLAHEDEFVECFKPKLVKKTCNCPVFSDKNIA